MNRAKSKGESVNYTKKHLPVELVYFEEFLTVEAAYEREKQIQKWTRKKKEVLIRGDFSTLHKLAVGGSTTLTKRSCRGLSPDCRGER